MKEIFGILAIALGLSAGIPYIISIVRGSTKPHRVSWAIWALLGSVTLSSYISIGARWSVLLAVAALINNLIIFILSLKYGYGGTSTVDRLGLLLAMTGVLLWAITREASYALVFAVTADAIGTAFSIHKAYKSPESENGLAWSIAATASLFGLLAVNSYNFLQTIYPTYALLVGTILALTTIIRQAKTRI